MIFPGKNWHLFLLAFSIALFAFVYVSSIPAATFDSDTVLAYSFYRDVAGQGNPAHEWYWCAVPYLFPDLVLTFFLHLFIHDDIRVAQACAISFFLGLIGLLLLAYRWTGGRRSAVFTCGAALLSVAFAQSFGSISPFAIIYFGTCEHGGGILCLLAAWALAMRAWLRGGWATLIGLGLICMLAAGSDALFTSAFVGPMFISLLAGAILFPTHACRGLWAALTLGVGAIVGFLGVSLVFPPHFSRSGYIDFAFKPDAVLHSLDSFAGDFGLEHAGFVGLTLLDFVAAALCAGLLLARWRRLSPALFLVLAFTALAILLEWGSVILTGNFLGTSTLRYVAAALSLPLFLGCAFVAEVVPWSRTGVRGFALLTTAILVLGTLHPREPGPYYGLAHEVAPVLRELRREGVSSALSEYWFAKSLTFLTGDVLPFRQVQPNGLIYWWENSLAWYAGNGAARPEFRLVLLKSLDPDAIRARFGSPVRTLHVEGLGEMWVYSPEDVISYQPIFHELANRHGLPAPNAMLFPARALPGDVGQFEGGGREARSNRDHEGCLTFSPYAHLQPGRYRIDLAYAYLTPPAPDKPATYDSRISDMPEDARLDSGTIPFRKIGPDLFSRTIAIPETQGPAALFEARTYYHASADFRLDSLTLTYLGP